MSIPITPLAGLATYAVAAKPGFGVEDNVRRFLRYAWIEKKAMQTALYWLAPTPEWEVKEAVGLHASLDAEHAGDIRKRVGEMRNPVPPLEVSPDAKIDTLFNEILAAKTTLEKIIGLYGVLKPALLATYQAHLAALNPVFDHPTYRMLKHMILDEEETVAWGLQAVDALTQTAEAKAQAETWSNRINLFLAAAGGIGGDGPAFDDSTLPEPAPSFVPDYFPQRDERFVMQWNFVNPQRQVSLNEAVDLDERLIALMCRRITEMDVPEYMSRIIAEAQDEPWDYYVDMTRHLWDEVRHAMMGTIYFESRSVDWKRLIAIHPGMSIRLGTLGIKDAHLVLFAIEQNLMPAATGKKLEYMISKNAKDELASTIQDYDWADEVLHVHIGRKWLLPKIALNATQAKEKGWQIRAETVHALDEYEGRGEQRNWWPDFAKAVLGRETQMETFDVTRL
ncbi:MAG: hypothetical protein KBG20_16040 [Caldilineaceae bacterium]|nr:hypothetical protein [Caldilineaceae bacterium]MBP8108480.1 hypothetical protein [Caldilineaceae bacterium]MBP8123705.1 hypothetical protein [Caldilineaceae bacterium]MBP9073819.1 hypothetical protein [Caldilineaceae bacterium]